MTDFIEKLVRDAAKTVESGYYKAILKGKHSKLSLKEAIHKCKVNAIITEIKAASPSLGTIRNSVNSKEVAQSMARGGAIGISVLTEPKHFSGSLTALVQARQATKLPLLMKDIVIVTDQIEVAAQIGANAVLLIQALFDRNCCEMDVYKMISFAHSKGLEVLLETHTQKEFAMAVGTKADLIGINNRNLSTLKIDLNTTKQILQNNGKCNKTIVSESGIQTKTDLQFLKAAGADAFLIGSSIMLTENIENKVREFVQA
jgi:indole-3-glycerol phosphate synthase